MNTHFKTLAFPLSRRLLCSVIAAVAITGAGCGERPLPPRAPYVPVKELEGLYGRLITAANHPTPDQHGTGERIGLFREHAGTAWGLPLATSADGTVLGCALPALSKDIVGATNAPTGWRGGTGQLELVFRDKSGEVHCRTVASGALTAGAQCWAQEPPGPTQRLEYYRLAPPGGHAP